MEIKNNTPIEAPREGDDVRIAAMSSFIVFATLIASLSTVVMFFAV